MRVPISWMREFVDVPDDVTPEQIHAALVKVGFEEEAILAFGLIGPIVVGHVLAFEPEPQSNGKTINWCQVDVGEVEPRGIVCGAHNFAVGDRVVVALPGAVLPGPTPREPFIIAARTTYGHVSDGMMASARELGLGEEHTGILLLKDIGLHGEVGEDAIALLGLDDFAVDVNVTPDRGYALSIRGIAREYAHSTGAVFHDPAEGVEVPVVSGFDVVVSDDAPIRGRAASPVFITRVVRGVDTGRPTPSVMLARLTLAGIRSVSLPVDITNYVMLELGQPVHAYDLDKLTGGIVVRRARPGETLTTLDHRARTLNPEDLLIADGSGAIGLAGVMGGLSTEVDSKTASVLVEAANFDPVSIARTARRHKLSSEASRRFERGVDPAIANVAAARVVQLLETLAGGTADLLGSVLDESRSPVPIDLGDRAVEKLIGVHFSADEIVESLTQIGCRVEATDDGWQVTPPSWRPDLTDSSTLAEEVTRIVGYDRIPSVLPVAPPGRGLTREQRLRRSVANGLAAAGATEVLAYPFVSRASIDRFGAPDRGGAPALALANPLDPDASWMRTSLWPGLIATARRNISRGLTDLAIFEIGSVTLPAGPVAVPDVSVPLPPGDGRPSDAVLGALRGSIPPQPWHVGALFLGDSVSKQPGLPAQTAGLTEALDAVRQIAALVGTPVRIVTGRHPALHPGRTAEVRIGERVVGYAGELLPTISAEFDLPRVVALVELNLDLLMKLGIKEVIPSAINAMPAATQDVSLVVPNSVSAGDLLSVLVEGAGELLEHSSLVDDYRGAGVAAGSKSLTFAFRFRARDRTLTAGEATAAKNAAVALAGMRLGAVLRE